MVLAMPELIGWALDYVDIAQDPELLSAFGEQIPVLALPDNTAQLQWPFAASDVRALLSASVTAPDAAD